MMLIHAPRLQSRIVLIYRCLIGSWSLIADAMRPYIVTRVMPFHAHVLFVCMGVVGFVAGEMCAAIY